MTDETLVEVVKNQQAIEQKVEDIYSNVNLLIDALSGNRLTKQGGMLDDIKDTKADIKQIMTRLDATEHKVENRLIELETTQKKWMFLITVVMAIAAICGGVASIYNAFKK